MYSGSSQAYPDSGYYSSYSNPHPASSMYGAPGSGPGPQDMANMYNPYSVAPPPQMQQQQQLQGDFGEMAPGQSMLPADQYGVAGGGAGGNVYHQQEGMIYYAGVPPPPPNDGQMYHDSYSMQGQQQQGYGGSSGYGYYPSPPYMNQPNGPMMPHDMPSSMHMQQQQQSSFVPPPPMQQQPVPPPPPPQIAAGGSPPSGALAGPGGGASSGEPIGVLGNYFQFSSDLKDPVHRYALTYDTDVDSLPGDVMTVLFRKVSFKLRGKFHPYFIHENTVWSLKDLQPDEIDPITVDLWNPTAPSTPKMTAQDVTEAGTDDAKAKEEDEEVEIVTSASDQAAVHDSCFRIRVARSKVPKEVVVTLTKVDLPPVTPQDRDFGAVYSYVMNRLACNLPQYVRQGRRFYHASETYHDRLKVMGGFTYKVVELKDSGYALHLSALHRAVHKKHALMAISQALELEVQERSFPMRTAGHAAVMYNGNVDYCAEWRRRLENSAVVALHSNKVYRVRRVRFDMNPKTEFELRNKKTGRTESVTFEKYFQRRYGSLIAQAGPIRPDQPLLECYPERKGEQVFLLPQLTLLSGLSEEMRRDRNLMHDLLEISQAGVANRLASLGALVADIQRQQRPAVRSLLKSWGVSIDTQPLRASARLLPKSEVSFGAKKFQLTEEGSFQRHTRHGLVCPISLDDWIAIVPTNDAGPAKMWLKHTKDVALNSFAMQIQEPQWVTLNNMVGEVEGSLMDMVTPTTQMVLAFLPMRDNRRIYTIIKRITCTLRPCLTQCLRLETIRKQQSIAAIMARVAMQMNAKFLGPLWHIDLYTQLTPMLLEPCMMVGIDVQTCRSDGLMCVGFTASKDMAASMYYSTAKPLPATAYDDTDTSTDESGLRGAEKPRLGEEELARLVGETVSECMSKAFQSFADHNDGALPTHIVVYRGSAVEKNHHLIEKYEVAGVQAAIDKLSGDSWIASKQQQSDSNGGGVAESGDKASGEETLKPGVYQPTVQFVACATKTTTKFFVEPTDTSRGVGGMAGPPGDSYGKKNPLTGTVVDSCLVAEGKHPQFWLVNQQVPYGTAAPSRYTVLHNTSPFSLDALQNLSYRLSLLYYNFPGAVTLPAPVQYARKLADLVGNTVKQEPHTRLRETLFFL